MARRLYVAGEVAGCVAEFLSSDAFYIVEPICLPFKNRASDALASSRDVVNVDDGRFDRYDGCLLNIHITRDGLIIPSGRLCIYTRIVYYAPSARLAHPACKSSERKRIAPPLLAD